MSSITLAVPSRHCRTLVRAGALAIALATLACAGGGAPESGAAPATGSAATGERAARPDSPLRIVSSTPLRISVRRSAGASTAAVAPDLWYTVRVEADGKPNLGTLVVGGQDGRDNRDAIVQWLSTVRFEPARRGGVPVAAEFDSRRR